MATFTDRDGKEWLVEIDVGSARLVKKTINVDLLDVQTGGIFRVLGDDIEAMVDTLWLLVKQQADKAGIDEMDFARRLGGDTLDGASRALEEAIIDFFPQRRRAAFAAALKKVRALEAMQMDRMETMLQSGKLDQMVNDEMDKAFRDMTSGRLSTT